MSFLGVGIQPPPNTSLGNLLSYGRDYLVPARKPPRPAIASPVSPAFARLSPESVARRRAESASWRRDRVFGT